MQERLTACVTPPPEAEMRQLRLGSWFTIVAMACSSPSISHHGGNGGGGGTGIGGNGNGGGDGSGGGGPGGSGGSGGGGGGGGSSTGGGGGTSMNGVPQNCPGTGTTTISGTVLAPNGTLPLYNAIVYVPSTKPAPFTDGVTCQACNGQVSGKALVSAYSQPDGSFTMPNSPWGANVPLVIEMGKWRIQTVLPNVTPCAMNPVSAAQTTLPKNHSQGDMPKMAIATGLADPFECLLLKIGIDPNEIQPTGMSTRIEFYVGANAPGTQMQGATQITDVTNSLSNLLKYDILMLPCEGKEYVQEGTSNLVQYLNMGGRVFSTHYSYDWLSYSGSPFNAIESKPGKSGLWDKDQSDYADPLSFGTPSTTADLVTTFPKGMAFSQWLKSVGVAGAPSTITISDIRHDINGVNPKLAQAWATDTMYDGKPGVAHLTFDTPLNPSTTVGNGPMYCGRAVYSDFHVAQMEADQSIPFPMACMGGDMTDQEKALAFMLFDLSSCVQPDSQPPPPIQ
jgi:hypothetical protein